jgi:hypothetical protein|tara:strand:+ start:1325 stop:1522 length:198 start_codon:yes stop_codon:yes gene_type:complete
MDAIHLVDYLLKSIRERDARLKSRLADNSIQTFEEYRYVVGEIRGMAYVEDEIKTAMKGMEYEDD